MLKIEKYNHASSVYQLSKKVLTTINLSDSVGSLNRETIFIEDICKRVEKSKTVLYVLKYQESLIGLVAMSATSIKDQPSMQIDYIFVNKEYRSKKLDFLDSCKPFRYLIDLSISIAKDIQAQIGLRYIVLAPDNDDIKSKYEQVGFSNLDDDWMFLKLD